VPRTAVYEYFEILKDTLLLCELPSWRKSKKRKSLHEIAIGSEKQWQIPETISAHELDPVF